MILFASYSIIFLKPSILLSLLQDKRKSWLSFEFAIVIDFIHDSVHGGIFGNAVFPLFDVFPDLAFFADLKLMLADSDSGECRFLLTALQSLIFSYFRYTNINDLKSENSLFSLKTGKI